MKASLTIVLLGLALACAYPAADLPEDDFSYDDDSEWTMIPDVDGNFHLVNIKELEAEDDASLRAPLLVIFKLFTKLNPTEGQIILNDEPVTIVQSNFNPSNPTRIITHGWQNDGTSSINTLIRDAYLQRGDYNIIVVDWSSAASSFNYISAKRSVDKVGKEIASFIDFLHSFGGLSFETTQLIGHSLGAHASGFAGKNVQKGRINSIIGLDPASPLFSYKKPETRLDINDADYVETIHTNGGLLGLKLPIGHTSFYPNWGSSQPGCGWDTTGTCSHSRSYQYYSESLQVDNEFLTLECENLNAFNKKSCDIKNGVKMGGEPSNYGKKGIYYVPTNSVRPFALGKFF